MPDTRTPEYKFTYPQSRHEVAACFPLISQLRTHLTEASFLERVQRMQSQEHYRLTGIESQGKLVALMGLRTVTDFVRGTHLYVDDLVTDAGERSKGWGAILLQEAERQARTLGFSSLRLCAVFENERGRKFYETQGWAGRAIQFVRQVGVPGNKS